MAWGFAGDEGIGLRFGKWLKAWEWPADATWDSVSDQAAEQLSRLNGRRRELAKIAGVEAGENDLTTVLMAGYIGGEPNVVEISDRGAAVSVIHNELCPIGTGQAHALIAFVTAKSAGVIFHDTISKLVFIVSVAAAHAPLCNPPLRVLMVTPDRVGEVSRAQPNKPTISSTDQT